jgi:type II secretory pathway component GspD/PulD (secretin)
VPFLSRLPLVGWIFGRTHRTTAETELFIFLTPRVLRDDAAMDSATAQVRRSARRVGKVTRGLKPFAAPEPRKGRGTPPPPAAPPAAAPAAPPARPAAEPRAPGTAPPAGA